MFSWKTNQASRAFTMVSPEKCAERDSGQILQLKVERSVLLKGPRVLLDYGENGQSEPASIREGELVERRQAGQKHWPRWRGRIAATHRCRCCAHHRGMMSRRSRPTLQGKRSLDAKSHATSSVWSDVAFACGACHACDAWPQRRHG